MAGNFGEPRPGHFHCGIDVRTEQVEGKPIFSVADGYVSRITVGHDGYGNALYIRHPNGVTSVYCHLKKFVPQLTAFVRKWQYQHESSLADVELRPTDFPVARGQLVAVSGSTGASLAPHLHLEFHETNTGARIDPLTYLKDFVTDTTPPMIHAFMAYPVSGEGVFCGSGSKQSYSFSTHDLQRQFTAWGQVGFGIWANDYMDDSYGILGVRHVSLFVDGHAVFESDAGIIPARCIRMVNSWGDYERYCSTRVWYMRSFVEPGNIMPAFTWTGRRGVVSFDEERDYHLVYKVTDVFGNTGEYSFNVRGERQYIPPRREKSVGRLLRHDRFNAYQLPGVSLFVSSGSLHEDLEPRPSRKLKPDGYSDEWRFHDRSYPLSNWARVSLRLNKKVEDVNKLYIVCHNGYDRYMEGYYQDGWVSGKVRELGASYEIAYDDVPPVISGLSVSAKHIRVSVSDVGSGLKAFRGYVDGVFVLFEKIDKTSVYTCDLSTAPIKRKGCSRHLRLLATDNRNNERVIETEFNY